MKSNKIRDGRLIRLMGQNWHIVVSAVWIVLFISCGNPRALGQEAREQFEQVLNQHTYSMGTRDGELFGSAVDWIEEKSDRCQFILFGEQHGVAGLPEVVAAIYSKLRPKGFEHLIFERGPWISRRLSRDGVSETLRRFPHAVAFDYDGELRLLRRVELEFRGRGDAFWGIDQSLNAINALKRLSSVLPTYGSRRAARGLLLKDALQGGRFLSRDHSRDIEQLRDLAGGAIGDEAKLILDALAKSQSIFVAYHNNERTDEGIGVSDVIREQYMMDQLDQYLAESNLRGEQAPKAVLKMGGAHVMEGIGPNGVRTLGDHMQNIAEANRLDALHLSIHSYSADSNWPESVFDGGEIALIDVAGLRQLMETTPEVIADDLHREVLQYDAVVLMKGAGADTSLEMGVYEAQFRRSLISSVAVVLFPLLTSISLLVQCIRKLLNFRARKELLNPFLPWLMLAVLSVGLMAVVVIQVLRIRQFDTPELSRLSESTSMSLLEVTCVIIPGLCCVLMARNSWWSKWQRVHFVIASIGLISLALFCHWWNLGRMIG